MVTFIPIWICLQLSIVISSYLLGDFSVVGIFQGILLSEVVFTLIHQHLWHGPLQIYHKVHHVNPGGSQWNSQDTLAVLCGIPTMALFWILLGKSSAFGCPVHYFLVTVFHDIAAHGRGIPFELFDFHDLHHQSPNQHFSVLWALLRPRRVPRPKPGPLKICVVGAGVGGLTAASFLRQAGHDVTVIEKNSQVGGRCSGFTMKGHHFDIGASMVLFKGTIDSILAQLGLYVQMDRCDPAYTIHFKDDVMPFQFKKEDFERIEPGSSSKFEDFLESCKMSYLAVTNIMFPRSVVWSDLNSGDIVTLLSLVRYSFVQVARRFFKSSKLVLASTFEMAFLGNSPSETGSAVFGCLPFSSHREGVWYPHGKGMMEIPLALKSTAGTILTDETVESVVPGFGVKLTSGEFVHANVIVMNTDMETPVCPGVKYGPTSYNFYWVLKHDAPLPRFGAHSFYTATDDAQLLESLEEHFDPQDFFFYVHEPRQAQEKRTRGIVVLVPLPTGIAEGHSSMIENIIMKRLGLTPQHILAKRRMNPVDWKHDFGLTQGSILGPSHTWDQMGPFRPSMEVGKGVYRVGASTHPGTGIPCAMQSGKLVAELIQKNESSVLQHMQQSRTFGRAAKLLGRKQYRKIKTLYSFFRLLDDLVDEHPGGQQGLRIAQEYVDKVTSTYSCIDPGLLEVQMMNIPINIWDEFLLGMKNDANRQWPPPCLITYCNQVAGTVGVAIIQALGLSQSLYSGPARELGVGLQLINICRDIQKDYRQGRYFVSVKDKDRLLNEEALPRIRNALKRMNTLPWKYRLCFHLAGECYAAMGFNRSKVLTAGRVLWSSLFWKNHASPLSQTNAKQD